MVHVTQVRHRMTVIGLLIAVCGFTIDLPWTHAAERRKDAYASNHLLGRGVNLGNALEAPREGVWGMTIRKKYFRLIRQAGFQSVRIPIRWSAHVKSQSPYTIDPKFFHRVDEVVRQALAENLVTVINVHHFEELYDHPADHRHRFLAMWFQIAEHYRRFPDRLFFELLNEPHGKLDDAAWNALLAEALSVVRRSHPRRMVIVGPGHWNNISHLSALKLPDADRRLIVTVHYYQPFRFTHQGAGWVRGSDRWLGTTWTGTDSQRRAVRNDFDRAVMWAKQHNRPLFLGEFGAYSKAGIADRVRWTGFIRQQLEQRKISWAYWEFGAGFGIYDRTTARWREPLLSALIPKKEN